MILSAYTPAVDTHQFLSDALGAGTETSGTGYTAGGQALTGVTVAASGHVITIDCNDPSWNAATGSLAGAFIVFYDSSPGSNATDPLIAYWDLGGTQTAVNSTFGLTINASGLVTFTGTG